MRGVNPRARDALEYGILCAVSSSIAAVSGLWIYYICTPDERGHPRSLPPPDLDAPMHFTLGGVRDEIFGKGAVGGGGGRGQADGFWKNLGIGGGGGGGGGSPKGLSSSGGLGFGTGFPGQKRGASSAVPNRGGGGGGGGSRGGDAK